jgi:PhnB protein
VKTIIPNLFIENTMENLNYYQGIFGGEIKNTVPSHENPERLMHAELYINENCVLFFGDREKSDKPNDTIHVYVKLETDEEIQKIYDNLKTTSTVGYELQKTFWGSLHAMLTDKNGIIWDLDK